MAKKRYLFTPEHIPEKPRFPVIDAHNHLWGNWQIDKVVKTMDEVGVVSFCDVTANVKIAFEEGGYKIRNGSIDDFFKYCSEKYPGRFYCFTMSEFAHPADEPLYDDPEKFVDKTIETLHKHTAKGARGLKILKELGLSYKDSSGELIGIDEPALFPIWREVAKLGVPVLMHQSDPYGFFEPIKPDNEHYESLKKFPSWSFADAKFPRKEELLEKRDNLIARHPETTFILPHVANFAEDLPYVASLLDNYPNVYIDFSARLDELGRQPYTARDFLIKYQDRIIFGTDMPANIEDSVDMYRCYFRFMETFDEGFYSPDYDGTFDRSRWPICGIGLPDEVLKKIYYKNTLKIIPGLEQDLKEILPDELKGKKC
jgi:predicted TIM-barrel fold metal-dependent hydrolase